MTPDQLSTNKKYSLKMLIFDAITMAYGIIALAIFVPWILLSITPDNPISLQVSDLIYQFFSFFCHQLWLRSLFFNNIKAPVCARCTTIYLATIIGLAFFRLKGYGTKEFKMNYVLLVLLFLPTALDGITQLFGWRESTNLLRLLAGTPFGLGYAYLIAWGLPLTYALTELITITIRSNSEADPVANRIKKMIWPL
ncbi:MAG TPA: DUF2085 domain-containing protein [Methanocella sp.]|nr:DUF2085 domain-containing protein [Methanocella sp.]